MPEGPSLVILRDETQSSVGHTIVAVEGTSSKIDIQRLPGQQIRSIRNSLTVISLEFKGVDVGYVVSGLPQVSLAGKTPGKQTGN